VDEQAQRVRLVVGLGNPGRRYEKTRHNVGFRVVDALGERWQASSRPAHDAVLYDARVGKEGCESQRVLLAKPQTFMNRSGQSVVALVRYYRVAIEDVLVVQDDIALPTGRLRARPDGSAGGHKGLADIQRRLSTQDVARLRIGVGEPPPEMAAEDYVLGKFAPGDDEAIVDAIAKAQEAVMDWIFEGITPVMNRYNAMTPGDSAEPTENGSPPTETP
jgi:peptidyl-tRNA hydrolase, PTH1 family